MGTVFYVGKGKGNRVFQHATDALERSDVETDKLEEIRAILASGLQVESFIVRHGIDTEKQAYEIEAAVIDAMRLAGHPVHNEVAGHGHRARGLVHTSVVASLYDAPEAPPIDMPAILIRIPRLWTPQMPPVELFEATRGWWVVGPQRERAKVAFAVSAGVIRGAYRIHRWRERAEGDRDWEDDIGKKPRWGFDGEPAEDLARFLNTSVGHRFRRGQANPIAYVNC